MIAGVIVISVYSGKCDCYDTLVEINKITDFSNTEIYAGSNRLIPLRIDSQKDLMPFYPYLITMISSSKNGVDTVYLSDKSYVDKEEEEWLQWRLTQLKKYYRRCKRNHVDFDDKKAIKKICVQDEPEDYEVKLTMRVKTDGEKATYDGVHTPFHDHYRQKLYDDMVAAGYNKFKAKIWCFGWRGFDELLKDDETKK